MSKKRANKNTTHKNITLSDQVRNSVTKYFNELNGESPCDVYQLVISEVEKPLIKVVMEYSENNQSRASRILGINRNTLRKKLEIYNLD